MDVVDAPPTAPATAPPNPPPTTLPWSTTAIASSKPRCARAIIIPGNGGSALDVEDKGWYATVRDELAAIGIDAVLCYEPATGHMPDPDDAKRHIWGPFVEERMAGDDLSRTILIGHSSGAACALRLLEKHKVYGALLVSAYHTHLGMASEMVSGYFPNAKQSNGFAWGESGSNNLDGGPWRWDAIRRNAGNGNLAVVNSTHKMEAVPSAEGIQVAKWLGVHCELTDAYINFPQAAISDAALAVAHGVAGRKPAPVRVLALTTGLSSRAFQGWDAELPRHATLTPLDLPSLVSPSAFRDGVRAVAAELADKLIRESDEHLDRPSILFGHGVGAWLAWETLCALRLRARPRGGAGDGGASGGGGDDDDDDDDDWQPPQGLIVSGMRPPHLHGAEHCADRRAPRLAKLASAKFWEAFERRYGLDPEMADLKDFFEPSFKKELALLETYTPSATRVPPVPPTSAAASAAAGDKGGKETPDAERRMRCGYTVTACAAQGDPCLLPGDLEAWQACCEDEGEGEGGGPPANACHRFEAHLLAAQGQPKWATPNRYLLDAPREFQRLLAEECVVLGHRASAAVPAWEDDTRDLSIELPHGAKAGF